MKNKTGTAMQQPHFQPKYTCWQRCRQNKQQSLLKAGYGAVADIKRDYQTGLAGPQCSISGGQIFQPWIIICGKTYIWAGVKNTCSDTMLPARS